MIYLSENLALQRRNLTSYIYFALICKNTSRFLNGQLQRILFLKNNLLAVKERLYLLLKPVKKFVKI